MTLTQSTIRKVAVVSGILVAALMLYAAIARANTQGASGLSDVDTVDTNWGTITKVYDSDADVVCYTFRSGSAGSISCVPHN